MRRGIAVSLAMMLAAGCMSDSTVTLGPSASAETFAGTWRSVTPTMEFIRFTVTPTSSEAGVLAARLTFSGVAWEGQGRIDGDSLVTSMAMIGMTQPTGTVVARARDANTLGVSLRSSAPGAAPLELTVVREP